MSVSIYLKNFGFTLLKNAMELVAAEQAQKDLAKTQLKQLISLLAATMLSPGCDMRYKYNISFIVLKYLGHYQVLDSSAMCGDSYQLFGELCVEVKKSLAVDNINTVHGAIQLAENAFIGVTGADKF